MSFFNSSNDDNNAFSAGWMLLSGGVTKIMLGAIALVFFPLMLMQVLPTSLWGSSKQDMRTTSEKVTDALKSPYRKATTINTDTNGSLADAFTENTLVSKIRTKFNCGKPYYDLFFNADENGNYVNGTSGNTEFVSGDTGNYVYVSDGASGDEEGTKACYIYISFSPGLDKVETDDEKDAEATIGEITYAYALATNEALRIYAADGNGNLGTVSPILRDDDALEKANSDKNINYAGYVNYATTLASWKNSTRGQQLTEELYSRPGYSDQQLGLTIEVNVSANNSTLYEDGLSNSNPNSGTVETKPLIGKCNAYGLFGHNNQDGTYYSASACFSDDNYKKVLDLAAENGFVLRYPQGAEDYTGHIAQYWTFRYVGTELASELYDKETGNTTSLEEYTGISGGSYETTERTDLKDSESYEAGTDGGTDVTEAAKSNEASGVYTTVVNNTHYLSEDYKPDDLVLCDTDFVIRSDACDAYLKWQKAVGTYTEETIEDDTTLTDEEKKKLEEFNNKENEESVFGTAKLQDVTDGEGNMAESIAWTDYGKEIISIAGKALKNDDEETTLKFIKESADDFFTTAINSTTKWETNIKSNSGTFTVWRSTKSCIDLYQDEILNGEGAAVSQDTDGACILWADYVGGTQVKRATPGAENTYVAQDTTGVVADVKIPVYYNFSSYRKDEIKDAIQGMVGMGRCDFTNEDSSSDCTDAEAKTLFWQQVAQSYSGAIASYGYDSIACDNDMNSETYGLCDVNSEYKLVTNILKGNPTNNPNGSGMGIIAELELSEEVLAWKDKVEEYAEKYGVSEYVNLILAVMMQESGGKVPDLMQASESKGLPVNTLTEEESIDAGISYLAANLSAAKVTDPTDLDAIKLALQGYNYGTGYITWALEKYGGYSKANAKEYACIQSPGSCKYGDKNYADNVLRYYGYSYGSFENLCQFDENIWLNLNPYAPGHIGQCTWFAWAWFYEIYGYDPGFRGDGQNCVNQLVAAHPDRFEKSDTPVAGAVYSVVGGTYGHVGIIVNVDGDTLTILDGNWDGQNNSWEYAKSSDWKMHTATLSVLKSRYPGSSIVFANPK